MHCTLSRMNSLDLRGNTLITEHGVAPKITLETPAQHCSSAERQCSWMEAATCVSELLHQETKLMYKTLIQWFTYKCPGRHFNSSESFFFSYGRTRNECSEACPQNRWKLISLQQLMWKHFNQSHAISTWGGCNHNNVGCNIIICNNIGCNIIIAYVMSLNNAGKHQRFRSSGSNMHQQQQRQRDVQRKQKQTTCTQRTKTTYTRAKNQTACIRTRNQIASQSTHRTSQHAGTRTEPSSANTRM